MIGRSGERGSGISVVAARHDDDDDICIYIFQSVSTGLSMGLPIYIYISDCSNLAFYHSSIIIWGARGVIVIVTGYGHGDTSSIPGQD